MFFETRFSTSIMTTLIVTLLVYSGADVLQRNIIFPNYYILAN